MRGGKGSNFLHFMAADFLMQLAFESATRPWNVHFSRRSVGDFGLCE